jgi:hypothetical protein
MSDSDKDVERLSKAVGKLWVEQEAHQIVLVQVLGFLAQNPELRPAIKAGFERALSVVQTLAEQPPDPENPRFGVMVLGIIEDIRSRIFEKEKPKKGMA